MRNAVARHSREHDGHGVFDVDVVEARHVHAAFHPADEFVERGIARKHLEVDRHRPPFVGGRQGVARVRASGARSPVRVRHRALGDTPIHYGHAPLGNAFVVECESQ
jgi:hypothetical protein